MGSYVDGEALVRVVLVSLLLGASIPAVFAVGVRLLATPEGTTRPPARAVAGFACFAVVLAAIVFGVYTIVATD